MSKVTEVESLSPNDGTLDRFLAFALQAMVFEAAIVASKSVAWLLMMMGTLPNGLDVFIKEPDVYAGKPCPDNKDASDTEGDDEEEDEAADDRNEDGSEEEYGSGEEGEDEGGQEDGPEANGDGGSGDDDDGEEEEEEEEEEEQEEEEEEEELQPPAKKRK